jgi:hypothetical protein|nr:MAG TPA: hypothetical protein [Caudoviricetes sp.]
MTRINLEEVKKQAVHDGILEAICLLRETREKIYTLLEDEDVTDVIKAESTLTHMTSSLCDFTYDLCEIMGIIFSDKADLAIGKALKAGK